MAQEPKEAMRGEEQHPPPTQRASQKHPQETSRLLELFKSIDTELQSLNEASRLPVLIGELKTALLNHLITTVQLQGTSPTEKPIPLKERPEIRIQAGDLTAESSAWTPTDITKAVNDRLAGTGLRKILNTRRLPSGDLILTADSTDTKTKAEEQVNGWIQTPTKKYTVWVHGVKVSAFDNQTQALGIQKIYDQNPAIADQARILGYHWRKRIIRLKRNVSSLLVDIGSPEGANLLIREGIVIDGEIKEVELFDPQCLITRCFNCQGYGHAARSCRANKKCGFCAAGGHSHKICPLKGQKTKQRCANCAGRHIAGSQDCRAHQEEGLAQHPLPSKKRSGEHISNPVAQKPRGPGRPRQPLAAPDDRRLNNFFTPQAEHTQASQASSQEPEDQLMLEVMVSQALTLDAPSDTQVSNTDH
ncbi:hypothetical protein GB937_010797 [Aspergillus fischeri]|nr:hypothetical protein GB937_010797 [Aspergillus fischeri]